MSRLRSTLTADDGMTLIEVLVTIVIGMIVLIAALNMMDGGFTSSARVQDRVDAASRARPALDRATALLQAQVCNGTSSPVISGSATQVTFTSNLGNRSDIPTRYQLLFSGGRLLERQFAMNPTPDPTTGVYAILGAANYTQRVLVDRAETAKVTAPVPPVFRYYGTNDTATNEPVELPAPLTTSSAALVAPLPASDRRRVLRVDINLRVLPTRPRDLTLARRVSTLLQTSAVVTSNLDQVKLDKGPQCSA